MSEKRQPGLTSAYALETPEDSVKLYARWAETYDADFAQCSDYILPTQVALHYSGAGGTGPILDVGAGTGLLAQALVSVGRGPIDGTDISPEMLEIAEGKGLYRRLFEADLTKGLDVASGSYAGVVSSGTFTHGHVGPDAMEELLRITKPGGLLVLSINTGHFHDKGFEAKLEILTPHLAQKAYFDVPIYGPACTDEHRQDRATIAVLKKKL